MAERISVPGLAKGGTFSDYDANPNGQSFLISSGQNVLVTRMLGQTGDGLSPAEEIRRRVESTVIHRSRMPSHVLPTSHVVLQGEKEDGTAVVLLGRFSPKVDNVKPLVGMPDDEILADHRLCREIGRVYFGLLKILVTTGRLPDSGRRGNFGNSYPPVLRKITKRLTSDNVLVGSRDDGQRIVFVDPDWCIEPRGAFLSKAKLIAKNFMLLAARSGFFYGASLVSRVYQNNADYMDRSDVSQGEPSAL